MNYFTVILLIIILLLVLLLGIGLHVLVRLKRERDALSRELSLQSFAQTELIKKKIDLSMLQEQINPHFLYNTLEAIRSQAELADQTEISNATETLGNYFRYCINSHGEPVHLFEELQNIQDYYQIIRFRFFDRINMVIDIKDASVLQTYLPRLTIQPIVENAINHGLKDKIHHAVITISAEKSDNIVCLKISDNGCGMEEEQLRELEDRIAHPVELIMQQKRKHGIALPNVHHRIQLMFGSLYGIHIQSIPGEGTDICIDYPIDYTKIIKGQHERIDQTH